MCGTVKRRRSFLLSELLIACVLISLLLGSLGYWTRRIWVSHKEKEQVYRIFLHEEKMYRLLREFFLSTTSIKETREGLVFSFDRGVYIDPDLAGFVQGTLHYDPESQEVFLILASQRKQGHQEKLPLWNQVLAVEWKVFRNQKLDDVDRVSLTLVRKTRALPPRTLSYMFSVCG
ncbi:DUF1494 domain-containing protein [Chlamydia sp.]|uniref:DUF1494 domain-containing protein n=1 Tax=Chlamydia sp. TaxID=35827 RepID=UPI0025C08424|nr:DUF1494 domain-containing protein [Chlamydia sp.]MBQ8498938.1 DUF1494 domain-containing protein [Chlamydia sp.]